VFGTFNSQMNLKLPSGPTCPYFFYENGVLFSVPGIDVAVPIVNF
jgi:hypothetical protein